MLLDSFILLGTRSHVFGPRNVNVSDPEYVVRIFSVLNSGLLRRLYVIFMLGNIECIKLGDRLCFTLYIYVANF